MTSPLTGKKAGPGLPRRTALLWIALVVALLLLQLGRRGPARPEIPYSEFLAQLDRSNLARVEVVPTGAEVRGEFRSAVTVEGTPTTLFTVRLPFADPAPLVARLEQRGVPIAAARETSTVVGFLISLAPWLLIIGFWLLMFRQARMTGERALAFGRISARPLTADRPTVRFDDVAGCGEGQGGAGGNKTILHDARRCPRPTPPRRRSELWADPR